jgi:hypothetical protein
MTQSLTYGEIERQIVDILPELRPAAEYYWRVEGEPGGDPGPYALFESMFGAYVTILLAMPNSPRRDELLRRAFGLVDTMLLDGNQAVHALAFIGLLESQGAWWWRRAPSHFWDRRHSTNWTSASRGGVPKPPPRPR